MSKIEEKYGLKTGHAIALFAILILNVLWIIYSTQGRIIMGTLPLNQIVNILLFILASYYALRGYKDPHGNLMRYLILCCAALEAIQYINAGFTYPTYISYVFYGITILKAYMAGRLDHYKQNIMISAAVLIGECLILCSVIEFFLAKGAPLSFAFIMRLIGPVSLWLALAGAYITRYKLHKDAGHEDNK